MIFMGVMAPLHLQLVSFTEERRLNENLHTE